MIDLDEDFQGYLEDFGRTIVAKARVDLGVLSSQSEIVVSGEIVYRGDSILAKRSICGDLTHGDLISHNGVSYMVEHDPFASADNYFCRVPVTRLDPTEIPEVIISGGGAAPLGGLIYSGGGA